VTGQPRRRSASTKGANFIASGRVPMMMAMGLAPGTGRAKGSGVALKAMAGGDTPAALPNGAETLLLRLISAPATLYPQAMGNRQSGPCRQRARVETGPGKSPTPALHAPPYCSRQANMYLAGHAPFHPNSTGKRLGHGLAAALV
jgi:hypothetical protein